MSQLFPIIVRLYEQANERGDVRVVNQCLDALDEMFEARVGIVGDLARIVG